MNIISDAARYVWIARTAARSNLAYAGEVIYRCTFLTIILYIFLRLWTAVYSGAGEHRIGGLTLPQMLWYLVITEAIYLSAPRVFSEVDEDVRTGRLAVHLIRPLSYAGGHLSRAMGDRVVRFAINLAVGPNARCKFSLGITEEALKVLSPDELRAGLAHELGHVQLGHFAARKERRAAEKKTRDDISEKSTTAGAAVTAIPIIGPLLAVGVAGTQMVTESGVEGEYRAYDREEELSADRYGRDLLELVIGRVRACEAEVALLDRLVQARASRPWAAWLSTHPRPADRLKEAKERCPG